MTSKYCLTIKKVEADDHGDEQFNYYSVLHEGTKEIWSDYTTHRPSLEEVLGWLEIDNNLNEFREVKFR